MNPTVGDRVEFMYEGVRRIGYVRKLVHWDVDRDPLMRVGGSKPDLRPKGSRGRGIYKTTGSAVIRRSEILRVIKKGERA